MSSNVSVIPLVIKILIANTPSRIIDVGAGYGKYGVLTRLYLESVRYDRSKWELTIDAVEPFTEYLTNTRHFYDEVLPYDALEVVDLIENYDMVFFFDVIEHFDKEVGTQLLKTLLRQNRSVLLCTPEVFVEQDDCHGNVYQIHKSLFIPSDFESLGLKTIVIDQSIFAYSSHLRLDLSLISRRSVGVNEREL